MEPSSMSPREAGERYVDRRRTEITEASASAYYYRLKLWWEWCEEQEIETVAELSGWVFEQYEAHRASQDVTPNTLQNEMKTLKRHIEYLERIEAVEEGLTEKVHIPPVQKSDRSRDTRLTTDNARALLDYFRESDMMFGTRYHALLELAWHTGARVGALRALDLRDYDSDERTIEFVHRPETGTPLKNKVDGERVVSLDDTICAVLDSYIANNRWEKHDENNRQPLLSSLQGRPSTNTLRTWMYQATQPCQYKECPHGHEMDTCDYRSHTHASKCPSSRAPHHVRTGSLTWHRDCGVPKEVTSERTNATEDVIDEFYDKATKRERMELRRRPHLDKLSISNNE